MAASKVIRTISGTMSSTKITSEGVLLQQQCLTKNPKHPYASGSRRQTLTAGKEVESGGLKLQAQFKFHTCKALQSMEAHTSEACGCSSLHRTQGVKPKALASTDQGCGWLAQVRAVWQCSPPTASRKLWSVPHTVSSGPKPNTFHAACSTVQQQVTPEVLNLSMISDGIPCFTAWPRSVL